MCLHIVIHSYAVKFSIKGIFVKLTTFSTAKTAKKETKPISDSENASKTKARSFWTYLDKFCLCQQLFSFKEFSMEARLYNISKTKNATKLAKPTLESSYKFLLGTIKTDLKTACIFFIHR